MEIEKYYMKRGEELVDTLYDKGFLHPDLARKSFRVIEELIAFYIQSSVETGVKCAMISAELKEQ